MTNHPSKRYETCAIADPGYYYYYYYYYYSGMRLCALSR